ncbi:bifunctional DNA-formamidopyrimidine glycosylase/DNA-(apurinic or apyrimidinic site) lyase [Catenovulum sediminis]|uniref:Formamidopyrimidine-DNA glycosylase n=1 Tax=Catenovulum sediminis TaxID=1740262 RepID=A0ABV1RN51_9ALTE
MPELPEVEVTRLGITPWLQGQTIAAIHIYHKQLRWPIPESLYQLAGHRIEAIERRAKYLIVHCKQGYLLLHLGMSGKLRVVGKETPRVKHDHFEIELTSGQSMRLNDPRRFGAVLWFADISALNHQLKSLGPEPLLAEFTAEYLYQKSRNKQTAIKPFIMDNKIVVGVGNIYATESLFLSGIHPKRAAGNISLKRYKILVENIKKVLAAAIEQGGTTLKDFAKADGNPGYFAQKLLVYGRSGQACTVCGETLKSMQLGQRASVYCKNCQK